MRGARKLVPQPCHHDNASEFLPALAHCVKAFGVTLTRTGDVPDTGFSYLRALLIGAIPGVSFPHLCQYGVRLLSLPPPCDRGGPLIQFGSVMTAGSLTFGIRILNF